MNPGLPLKSIGSKHKWPTTTLVKLAVDYLDRYFEENHEATLVEMLEYADHGKLVLTLEEVNEALSQRPSVFVQQREGKMFLQLRGPNEISVQKTTSEAGKPVRPNSGRNTDSSRIASNER
jgi:hypothetical protein